MTTKPFLTISLLLFMAACAPQAEMVKVSSQMSDLREDVKTSKTRLSELQNRVELLDTNLKGTLDVQKVMADYGAKTDQLTTDIQLLQGKLEENNFRIAELAQKLDDKSVKIAELSARIDDLEAKLKPISAGTGTGSAADKGPKTVEPSEAYRQAKADFDKGNLDLALAGFQHYLMQFPETSQAPAAQYWIGECYYAKKDFGKAIDSFAKLIKTYPKSEKIAGAKLKIGLSYLNERNHAKAKEYLNKVIKDHPGTTEAAIAKDRLRKVVR